MKLEIMTDRSIDRQTGSKGSFTSTKVWVSIDAGRAADQAKDSRTNMVNVALSLNNFLLRNKAI